ncbi:hypothetical protein QQF64_035187 [Cirrhinus molitorella]|uniref:Uncharacterized protein n=1 Tax=Cirrhinus molitorella TaxID=172907 RepID=A0ABR3NF23_9TELE
MVIVFLYGLSESLSDPGVSHMTYGPRGGADGAQGRSRFKKRSSYSPSCCNASSTTLGGSVDPLCSSVHSLNKMANGHDGRSITQTP